MRIDKVNFVGVIEHLDSVLEIDAMLGKVARGFGRVPFEVHASAYR